MTDRLLTREVAERVGLRVETIRRYRVRGTFPEPDGHTLGHPWWRQKTVETWLRGRRIRKEHAVRANPCSVCGKPIHQIQNDGAWVHDKPYDPFEPPIHAPRP